MFMSWLGLRAGQHPGTCKANLAPLSIPLSTCNASRVVSLEVAVTSSAHGTTFNMNAEESADAVSKRYVPSTTESKIGL